MQIKKETSAARQVLKAASTAANNRLDETRKTINQLASAADRAAARELNSKKRTMISVPGQAGKVVKTWAAVRTDRTARLVTFYNLRHGVSPMGRLRAAFYLILLRLPSPLMLLL